MSTEQLKYNLPLYMFCYLLYNDSRSESIVDKNWDRCLVARAIDKPGSDDLRSCILHSDF